MNHRLYRRTRDSFVLAIGLSLFASAAFAQEAPPRAAPRITFEDAIQRAMARSPTSELAREDIKRAEALVQQARSTWLPMLTANATYTRLDSDRVFNDRVLTAQDTLGANLTLTVPLIAPRQWVATARAKENRELANLTDVDTRRQVAISTGRAYLTVIAERRVLESTVQARDTARSHEEFAQSRFTGGIGNRLDYVRASQERATAETRVQAQTIALSRAQEALGIPPRRKWADRRSRRRARRAAHARGSAR